MIPLDASLHNVCLAHEVSSPHCNHSGSLQPISPSISLALPPQPHALSLSLSSSVGNSYLNLPSVRCWSAPALRSTAVARALPSGLILAVAGAAAA